jgi:hypothetical protein
LLAISAIEFWNYSKTPSRGVREIEIILDDNLIFKVDISNFIERDI